MPTTNKIRLEAKRISVTAMPLSMTKVLWKSTRFKTHRRKLVKRARLIAMELSNPQWASVKDVKNQWAMEARRDAKTGAKKIRTRAKDQSPTLELTKSSSTPTTALKRSQRMRLPTPQLSTWRLPQS